MTTITAVARCHGCSWTAGPGDWPTIDKAAERHTKAGHPTAITARPA